MRNYLPTKKQTSQQIIHVALKYRLPILSGILIGTSYIPFPPWALFFCLTPLFLFWVQSATNKKQAFFAGWITQFILNLIGFHWIAYTAIEFGHFPVWGGIASLIGFAIIAHLYYPIAGLIAFVLNRRLKVRLGAQFLVYAICFLICEITFPAIFPWHLGYPWLWAGFPGAQFADVVGFEGLNIATVLCNCLLAWSIAYGIFRRNEARPRAWWPVAVGAALIVLINLAGIGRANRWKDTDGEIKFLAVQGNIGNFDKYMAELHGSFGIPIVQKYVNLSREALQKNPDAQIMVWPETAFPAYFDREHLNGGLQTQVRNLLIENKIPLIAGAYSQKPHSQDTFNGIFYLNAAGLEPVLPYRKTILLAFGETFPFSDYIPYMQKLFPEQGSFTKGSGPTVWDVQLDGRSQGLVKLGPQICYEGLYPWFSAEMAHRGAEIFTNVTNDSWFGHPFESNQHLYMTMARAIEFRRPLVRVTNTGVSTASLATGELLAKSPNDVEWAEVFDVHYKKNPDHTFYETFDKFWVWILLGAIVLVLAFGRGFRLESQSGKQLEK